MPKYKLTYFDIKGRAEITRILLSYGKADWEDIRIEGSTWPELKPKMPFGWLPCLDVDGTLINNSGAINRYLAQEFGLFGDDAITRAHIDELSDYIWDHTVTFAKLRYEQDEAKKKEAFRKFFDETMPPVLKNLEKILTANGKKYLVGKKLSLADIIAYHSLHRMSESSPGLLDNHQLLKSHVETTGSIPDIKAWVDKHPTGH